MQIQMGNHLTYQRSTEAPALNITPSLSLEEANEIILDSV